MAARWLIAAVAAAFYFALAYHLSVSYVDPMPKGSVVIRLLPPFERYGFAAITYTKALDGIQRLADREDVEGDDRSPLIVYEDRRPLAPAHSNFAEISSLGAGRFVHWTGSIAFSASDNSDPNTNRRRYWAAIP